MQRAKQYTLFRTNYSELINSQVNTQANKFQFKGCSIYYFKGCQANHSTIFFQVSLYEILTRANVKHTRTLLRLWLDAAKLDMLRVIYKKTEPCLKFSSAAQKLIKPKHACWRKFFVQRWGCSYSASLQGVFFNIQRDWKGKKKPENIMTAFYCTFTAQQRHCPPSQGVKVLPASSQHNHLQVVI